MNANILKAAAIALPMVFGTAIADGTQQTQDVLGGIAPMSASELTMVTGAYYGGYDYCKYCKNYAEVYQFNVAEYSAFVYQNNSSHIKQSNN